MTQTEPDDLLDEVIALDAKLLRRGGDADMKRLITLLPDALDALEGERDGERYALAALSLFKALYTTQRLNETQALLHEAGARARSRDTQARVALTRAQVESAYNRPLDALATIEGYEPGEALSDKTSITLLYTRTLARRRAGDMEGALADAQQGVALARRVGDARGLVMMLSAEGGTHTLTGRTDEALECFESALMTSRRELRDSVMSRALESNIAATLLSAWRLDEAEATLERLAGLALEREAHDDGYLAQSNLAIVSLKRGDTRATLARVARADALFAASNMLTGESITRVCEALSHAFEGDPKARTTLLSARRIAHAESDTFCESICTLTLGLLSPEEEDEPGPHVENTMVREDVWEHCAGRAAAPKRELNPIERGLMELKHGVSLEVRDDFRSVRAGGDWIDLRRRTAARAILRTLVHAHPEPVHAWDLFDATWPDAHIHDTTALNRLYTAIHRMRALGLDAVLVFEDDGYRLTRVAAPRR